MNLENPQHEGGYAVYVPSPPGYKSDGDSKAEALRNIKEVIQ